MIALLRLLRRLGADRCGMAVLEFALVAPILLGMIVGIGLLGIVFYAQAGLRSTVEDAARYATTWPRPSEADIQARIAAKRFGMDPANIVAPTVVFTGSTSSSPAYVTISMGYNITIDYLVGSKTIALAETRRAYVTS